MLRCFIAYNILCVTVLTVDIDTVVDFVPPIVIDSIFKIFCDDILNYHNTHRQTTSRCWHIDK